MAAPMFRRQIIKIHKFRPYCVETGSKSVTGYKGVDTALKVVTAGKIFRWLEVYEDVVGLSEVKDAQTNVSQAENSFMEKRQIVRKSQQILELHTDQLKEVQVKLDRMSRDNEQYLEFVTEEYRLRQEERDLKKQLEINEEYERDAFAQYSLTVRESHEKERVRADKTKNWSIIGSICGTLIGFFGSSLINHSRMKELRKIVNETTALVTSSSVPKDESIKSQLDKLSGKIEDIVISKSGPESISSRDRLAPIDAALSAQSKKLDSISDSSSIVSNGVEKLMSALIPRMERDGNNTDVQYIYIDQAIEGVECRLKKHIILTTIVSSFLLAGSVCAAGALYNFFKPL